MFMFRVISMCRRSYLKTNKVSDGTTKVEYAHADVVYPE